MSTDPYSNINITQTEDSQEFNEWLTFNLDHEGRVYENVRGDSGGPTKYGVTWMDANAYFRSIGRKNPAGGIGYSEAQAHFTRMSYLSEDDIRAIYKKRYWDIIRGGVLPSPTDQVLADLAVNCGTGRAAQFARRTIGAQEGLDFSDELARKIAVWIEANGQRRFYESVNAQRQAFYDRIGAPGKTNHKFWNGWTNRVNDMKLFAAHIFQRKFAAGKVH